MNEPLLPPPIRLRDFLRILRRRWYLLVGIFVVTVAATVLLTQRMKTVYEAQARLLIENVSGSVAPSSVLDLLSGGGGNASLDVEVEKMRSQAFLTDVVAESGLTVKPEELRARVQFKASQGQIIDILARAPKAEEAVALANAVGRVYIRRLQAEATEKARRVQGRLQTAQSEVLLQKERASRALQAFATRLGVADPQVYFRDRTARTVQARNAAEDARRELRIQETRLAAIRQQVRTLKPELVSGYSLSKNTLIDSLKAEIELKRAERRLKLEDFAEGSDEIRLIDAEIAAKQTTLEKAWRDPYSVGNKQVSRNPDYSMALAGLYSTQVALRAGRRALLEAEALRTRLEAEQRRLTGQQYRFEVLRREYETAAEQYAKMRAGQSEARIKQVVGQPDARIFDPARLPLIPVSPRPLMNLALALFLGLFLGVGFALAVEYLQIPEAEPAPESLPSGLPQVAGVPVLGSLPAQSLPPPVSDTALPAPVRHTLATEDALREIGYTLAHRVPGQPAPVALLVGTRSDDSTAGLAAQVAATLVRDGLKVTLVDADRANPRLNRVFGRPDAPGLADALAGRLPVREALHVGAGGAFRFLAAGAPDDPAPLEAGAVRRVMAELACDGVDLVLVSGPSAWNVPAVQPLQQAIEGLVLVAAPGVPAEESVARARRLLSNGVAAPVRGVIVAEGAEG